MKYYRDSKVTVWVREYFNLPPDITDQEAVKLIQEDNEETYHSEYLFDTVEDMEVIENGEHSTIEIFNDNDEKIFENGK